MKVLVNESSLTAIADAIREKNGTSETYKPAEMGNAISNLPTGYNIPDEVFAATGCGDNSYKFAYNNWNWLIESEADKFERQQVRTGICFSNSLNDMPIKFYLASDKDCNDAFMRAKMISLDITPAESFKYYLETERMFNSCSYLKRLPENLFGEVLDSGTTSTSDINRQQMFYYCTALRNIPNLKPIAVGFRTVNKGTPIAPDYYIDTDYCLYNRMAYQCTVLDRIENLPVLEWKLNDSVLDYIIYECGRLDEFTFETNTDGTPKTAEWTNQILDLSYYVGWVRNFMNIRAYSIEMYDKRITDDATYLTLKNDPDNWTTLVGYSRYNKISAVNTINSLPDTSSFGTNTIKFKGEAGSLTDGGAINTLTEAEIAVATAKGWTVSLV